MRRGRSRRRPRSAPGGRRVRSETKLRKPIATVPDANIAAAHRRRASSAKRTEFALEGDDRNVCANGRSDGLVDDPARGPRHADVVPAPKAVDLVPGPRGVALVRETPHGGEGGLNATAIALGPSAGAGRGRGLSRTLAVPLGVDAAMPRRIPVSAWKSASNGWTGSFANSNG